jgi:anaerobic selenocysteine-containing dehydrogenase
VREPGGFVLRNRGAPRVAHRSGKAEFVVVPTPRIRLEPEGQLRLFTIRSHDQYNTTIYGLDDRYRGLKQARAA